MGCLCLEASATEGRQLPAHSPLTRPGDFTWAPELAADGEVSIIVHLPKQELYVYRGNTCIGSSTISSGRRGRSSPPGVYTILEKKVFHRSNLYQNAPMPFMQRLTWCGVAMHAGLLPGYPASHGCLRLPRKFSKLLFEYTKCGLTVIVTDAPMEQQAPEPMEKLEPLYAKTETSLRQAADSVVESLEPTAQSMIWGSPSTSLSLAK